MNAGSCTLARTGALEETVEELDDMASLLDLFRPRGAHIKAPLLAALKREGHEVLGEGGARVAVALNEHWVAKVAFCAHGVEQNQAEAEQWAKLCGTPAGELLAEVQAVTSSGRVLVMERVTPVEAEASADVSSRRGLLSALYRPIFDSAFFFNWGESGRGMVLLDYGNL